MSDIVIRAENVGKKYKIGYRSERASYVALRDVLAQNVHDIWRKTRDSLRGKRLVNGDMLKEFWALKNVDFEIRRGEVIGIIGRNGAGKSTLLKILSRITDPSLGCVRMRGRVGSLLEVGAGFHPELTGRENIFLNGAVLGMTRAEVRRRFAEIVAFAEVDQFLDTPVKRYSSGMYVRLAFSVAAHLEPDILIVDEVLALGDVEFQKKCLGKMHDVSKGGRTVLFVSHNMSTIMTLCSRAILLDHGAVRLDSSATETVQNYLRQYTGLEAFERGIGQADKLKIVSGKFACTTETNGFRRSVELSVWSDADRKVSLDMRVSEGTGIPVGFGSLGTFTSADLVEIRRGFTIIIVSFPTDFLANGTYALSFDVTIPFREYFDRVERCLSFGLERSVPIGQSHVATQNWGYGSLEIPVSLDQVTRISN